MTERPGHLGEPAWTGFVRRLQAVSATFAPRLIFFETG